MRKLVVCMSIAALFVTGGAACVGDDSNGASKDGGAASDGGGSMDSGGGADSGGAMDSGGGSDGPSHEAEAGPMALNGCAMADFVDDTADGGTINGPTTATAAPWMPACVKIKRGQSVTWNAALGFHPLEPQGGDTPNPITLTNTGTSVTVAFPNAGSFGYDCANHLSAMQGAVQVVP